MVTVIRSMIVKYTGYCRPGKIHGFALMKDEFPPDINWLATFNVKADSGYQGIESQYSCGPVSIPHKKPKGVPPDGTQKADNRALACDRIYVEHGIGGIKRYRCLSDRLRLHDFDLYNVILGVCTGLWNFYLTN